LITAPFDDGLADNLIIVDADHRSTTAAVSYGERLVSINYYDLCPGDVFLFSEQTKSPSISRIAIESYQAVLCGAEASKWRHVGILDESYVVWDAMPSQKIRRRLISDVIQDTCDLMVVRPNKPVDKRKLSEALLKMSGSQYKFDVQIGTLLTARLRRLPVVPVDYRQLAKNSNFPKHVICSTFVASVLRHATTYPFFKKLPLVIPADFFTDQDFTHVPLKWCEIRV